MKNFIVFLLLLISASSFAQPQISFVAPNNVFRGQTVNIYVSAENTHFQQNITNINLGSDITVLNLTVNSPVALTALVKVSPTTSLGYRQLIVTTLSETVQYDDAVEVMDAGSNVSATIIPIPTEALYLSDFDPNSLQTAPTVFTVTLRNDNQVRNLKVKFILSAEDNVSEEIVTATRNFDSIQPMAVELFNNKQFDEYNINARSSYISQVMQSGMMPAGTYKYKIIVSDENGNIIANDESILIITNNTVNISLIYPGNSFNENPEILATQYPFFQWLSTANSYDFFLYKVESGQKYAEEIINNIPLFEKKDINNTSLMYPNYAPILEKGQTYVWKVNAYLNTSKGKQTIISDIFWFTVQSKNTNNLSLVNLVVEPEVKTLKINEPFIFKAIGYDINNDTATVECNWEIIPSSGFGEINSSGLFKAGKYPKTIAVIADYNGLKAYSTVTIEWSTADYLENNFFDIEKLFNSVFGIKK